MSLPRTLWQVGSGDNARPYWQWMIDHHIVLVGPSYAGRWPNDEYGKERAVRRFAEDAKAGELVVVKHGVRRALAVGAREARPRCARLESSL